MVRSISAWKNATFTQYPRCGSSPTHIDHTSPCTHTAADNFQVMGYTIRTADGWRYTRWMPWTGGVKKGASVNWDGAVGEELYDNRNQSGLSYFASEVHNLATAPEHAAQRAAHLSTVLWAVPVSCLASTLSFDSWHRILYACSVHRTVGRSSPSSR